MLDQGDFGQRCRIAVVEGSKARLVDGLTLGGHIDRARWILADKHHGDGRGDAVAALELRRHGGHFCTEPRGAAFAVDDVCVHAWAASASRADSRASSPSISIVFKRDAAPEAICTSDGLTPSVRARSAISAAFALPSSGGAATRALSAGWPAPSLHQPSIASRPAFGVRRTRKRKDPPLGSPRFTGTCPRSAN